MLTGFAAFPLEIIVARVVIVATRGKCHVVRFVARFMFSFIFICAGANAFATDFAGSGLSAIPDNLPSGINVTFDTSSFNQPVGDLKLALVLTHTYTSDLKVTLISPGGVARLVIMSRVGRRTTNPGGNANLVGLYKFSDFGSDLWSTVTSFGSNATVPGGSYRTSTQGAEVGGTNDGGSCFTSLSGAFGGLSASDAGGIWTLNIADVVAGEVGNASAAVLSLQPIADGIHQHGFEIASRATCKLARMDFTGRGRSSFVLVRNMGGSGTGAITWYVKDNNNTAVGVETTFIHGNASDRLLHAIGMGTGLRTLRCGDQDRRRNSSFAPQATPLAFARRRLENQVTTHPSPTILTAMG